MPVDERSKRILERAYIKRAAKAKYERHVVCRAAGIEAVKKPEPLLRKGEWKREGLVRGGLADRKLILDHGDGHLT